MSRSGITPDIENQDQNTITNNGDGGGCTVGTNPAYDLALLLLALLAIGVVRCFRRRA